jgi:hypothetical protein
MEMVDTVDTDDVDVIETPLMQAVREEVLESTPESRRRRADDEADRLVDDIDDFVAETDPASLPAAEAEIDAWHPPSGPREPTDEPGDANTPLVSVFVAGTEVEANIVRGLLEAEGIPTTVSVAGAKAFGALLSVGAGQWGDVFVAPDDAEKAREVVAAHVTPP